MELDAIICPGGAFPAPPLKSADLLLRNTFSLFHKIRSHAIIVINIATKNFVCDIRVTPIDSFKIYSDHACKSLKVVNSKDPMRDFPSSLSEYKRVNGHGFISASGTYLSPYNVLNFPAGIVRMTSVTEEDDIMMVTYPDHDMWHKRVIEVRASIALFQLMP